MLGLDRRCTLEQIRNAYRLLAKQHHPDVNHGSREAVARTQELNAAYETLGDPDRRRAYDRELDATPPPATPGRGTTLQRNLTQDVNLRLEDFLRGTTREVRVHDPANPDGSELYVITEYATASSIILSVKRDMSRYQSAVRLKWKAAWIQYFGLPNTNR